MPIRHFTDAQRSWIVACRLRGDDLATIQAFDSFQTIFLGRFSLALKKLLDLGEAQSVYFNFFGRTRGGPVGIL